MCRFAKKLFQALCLTPGLGVLCSVPTQAQVPLLAPPFEFNFEQNEGYEPGRLYIDPWWSFSDTLSVWINGYGSVGNQSLGLQGTSLLTLAIANEAPASVAWVDFYVKPAFGKTLPEIVSGVQTALTGFVKVDAEGDVYAVDGDGQGAGDWVSSGVTVGLNSESVSDWIRLTYRLDYGNKRWDLFVGGQMRLFDLGFLDGNAVELEQFALKPSFKTPTHLDYLYVGGENPLYVDTSNDGIPDAWLIAQGLSIYVNQRDGDADRDGLSNLEEYLFSTSANSPDSDGDGIPDGIELLWGHNPVQADAYVLRTLPFYDDFGGYAINVTINEGNWDASDGSAQVVEEILQETPNYLLQTPAGTLATNLVAGASHTNVWVDTYMRPTLRSGAPEVAREAAFAYYFDADGAFWGFDGLGNGAGIWLQLKSRSFLQDGWVRVSVAVDYENQRYDLYLNGVRVGESLGLPYVQPFLYQLRIDGEVIAQTNRISAGANEPALLDNDGDGLSNAEELIAGTDPNVFDTDGDGMADSLELIWGFDPLISNVPTFATLTETSPEVFTWKTGFLGTEGYVVGNLDSQAYWLADGDVKVVAGGGVQLVATATDAASLTRFIAAGEHRELWAAFRARFAYGPLPDPQAMTDPAAALWGFPTERTLAVWDDGLEQWLTFRTHAKVSEWNDYAIYLDYEAKTWALFQNEILVAEGLPFRDENLVTLSRFKTFLGKNENQNPVGGSVVTEFAELAFSTAEPESEPEPGDIDSDEDGLPDWWELEHFGSLDHDGSGDSDGDGITDYQEFLVGGNPLLGDSNGDGTSDMSRYLAGLDLSLNHQSDQGIVTVLSVLE